jgi:hypothetical protein
MKIVLPLLIFLQRKLVSSLSEFTEVSGILDTLLLFITL